MLISRADKLAFLLLLLIFLSFIFEIELVKSKFSGSQIVYNIERAQFLRDCYQPKTKQVVKSLEPGYKFLTLLSDGKQEGYYIIGSSRKEISQRVCLALRGATHFVAMQKFAKSISCNPSKIYVDWLMDWSVKSGKDSKAWFLLKPSMLKNVKDIRLMNQFFDSNSLIKHVLLQNFNFSEGEVSALFGILTNLDQTQLQEIKIEDCNLSSEQQLKSVMPLIRHHSFLQTLHISNSKLTDICWLILCDSWGDLLFLEEIRLTHNPNLRGKENLDKFLLTIMEQLQIRVIDLSYNTLGEDAYDAIDYCMLRRDFYMDQKPDGFKLEEFNLSHNRFSLRECYVMYKLFQKGQLSKLDVKINLEPYPIYSGMINKIFREDERYVISFERVRISDVKKRSFLKKLDMIRIKELSDMISESTLMQKTIEGIEKLCDRICNLDFDFPPQYVEKLRELLREILNISFEANDCYSFEHAKRAALTIGLTKREISKQDKKLILKSDQFAADVQDLFNLKCTENEINKKVDDLVMKAIAQDLRGSAVDLLFYLKEKRDEKVNMMLKKQDGFDEVHLGILQMNPYFILTNNSDMAEKTRNLEIHKKEDWLAMHPKWLNYEEVSSMTRSELFDCLQKEWKKNQGKGSEKSQKADFMFSEPSTELYQKSRFDKQLRIARTICQYRWSKGYNGTILDDPIGKVKEIIRDVTRLGEIEKERIRTTRDYIEKEKEILLSSKTGNLKAKLVETDGEVVKHVKRVREKELKVINHPLDKLHGVSWISIQRIPSTLDIEEYTVGIIVNSYILKICNLSLEDHNLSMMKMIKKFITIGRGVDRIKQGSQMIKSGFISAEIYLNLVKFINTNSTEGSDKMVFYNGINLLTLLTFFLKTNKDICLYVISKFHQLVYLKLEEQSKANFNPAIIQQCRIIFSNLINFIESSKFLYISERLILPPEKTIAALFMGGQQALEFDITIIAIKKFCQRVKCRPGKFVHDLVKDLQGIEEMYKYSSLDCSAYWLYLESDHPDCEDIALNYEWTMQRVIHLQFYINSIIGSEKTKLVFKHRIYNIRHRLELDNNKSTIIECLFREARRGYLRKRFYHGFLTTDTIVEIASILHIINHVKDNRGAGRSDIDNDFDLKKIIPEDCIDLLNQTEWKRKLNFYLTKNSIQKKQKTIALKRKIVQNVINSPCFCSSIFKYKIKSPGKSVVNQDGSIVVNIYGVFFYEFSDFSRTQLSLSLEEITSLEYNIDQVILKYVKDNIDNDQKTIQISTIANEDLAYDIISCMIVGLRENKKLFYSYAYLAQFINYGKPLNSINPDPVTSSQIQKAVQEVKKLRELKLKMMDLAHTMEYNQGILDQSDDKTKSLNMAGGFSIHRKSLQASINKIRISQTIKDLSISGEHERTYFRKNSSKFVSNRSETLRGYSPNQSYMMQQGGYRMVGARRGSQSARWAHHRSSTLRDKPFDIKMKDGSGELGSGMRRNSSLNHTFKPKNTIGLGYDSDLSSSDKSVSRSKSPTRLKSPVRESPPKNSSSEAVADSFLQTLQGPNKSESEEKADDKKMTLNKIMAKVGMFAKKIVEEDEEEEEENF